MCQHALLIVNMILLIVNMILLCLRSLTVMTQSDFPLVVKALSQEWKLL